MSRPVLVPGPDHPITVTPHPGRVVVRAGGRALVDTERALELREASYPPVLYLPREDADLTALQPSDTRTYCPYKGDASYFSIPTADGLLVDAVWSYEQPYDAVPAIAGHLAFYPDRVEISAG
ncbi:DUF427 domain-containing protein [Nocardioides humi]|uniref:DUF427 domain-containing protein n=1 Tax=Nocardioides humi TaxID=449461 RepID=A0ABN2AUV8_9ACTN|nr:DUF427 domain-containing protein [Nocardioides humi]